MKYIVALLVCCFCSTSAFAQETYICIADLSTGFAFNKTTKNWFSTNFNVQDNKYVLSQKNKLWYWKKVGAPENATIECGEFNPAGYLNCSSYGQVLSFNKTNLRFSLTNSVGYVSGELLGVEGSITPFMTIGKCSPL